MEMEQLLGMGFSNELAAEALAATGGKSTLKATEWILTHRSPPNAIPNPILPPPPAPAPALPPHQPRLDRFFNFQSKPSVSKPQPQEQEEQPPRKEECEKDAVCPAPPLAKRPRTAAAPAQNPQPSLPFWHSKDKDRRPPHEPLSERMRPRTIDDVVGQDHLLSHKSLLHSAIECNRLPSIVLWGPPGTGKTSIAKAIVSSSAQRASYRFASLSAVTSGVKDVREAVDDARKTKARSGKRTVLFIDEVHRFNKSQQDSFLPVIEDGSIVFIGATTENPSFHLITPLLSRCRVLSLNPLKPDHISTLLTRAIDDPERGLSRSVGVNVKAEGDAVEFLANNCDGDARVALNALEISATTAAARASTRQPEVRTELSDPGSSEEGATVTINDVKEALQCKHVAYDKAGEEHYNLISALHKSMRGSDSNAAIYWLARMLEGGEEPLYIARRLVRFASEDVGLADPTALTQAVSCYQACHFIGMPECNVILAQCVAYLALAPKSIAVYRAIGAAQKAVRESVGQNEGVPLHLRNAPTELMKEVGYGKGYIYTPDDPSAAQSFLPASIQGYKFLDWPENKSTGT